MPGGRLTQQDRREIAAGLSEGLGYAEIARRLNRPTSTVSREVMRNGGADGYRPDQAHRATVRRARRSQQHPPPERPVATDAYGRDPAAVRDFEERFAALFVRTGLPRMPANVLTCLFTTDSGSLTSAELVRRLRVSPASVSKAIGHLEEQGLIRREREAGQRAERYVVGHDDWYRAWQASMRTTILLAEVAQSGAEVLGSTTPAGARLEDMGEFLAHVTNDLAQKAEYWRQFLAEQRARALPDGS
jgi:DNA-binding transcriptional regulator GbsR (MarR family)